MLTFAAAADRERNRQVQQHVNAEPPLPEIDRYCKTIVDAINGDAAEQSPTKRQKTLPKQSKSTSYDVRVR